MGVGTAGQARCAQEDGGGMLGTRLAVCLGCGGCAHSPGKVGNGGAERGLPVPPPAKGADGR